ESITSLVKDTFYKDAFALSADATGGAAAGAKPATLGGVESGMPLAPQLDEAARAKKIPPLELGLSLDGADADGQLPVGAWYPVRKHPGVSVSAVTPQYLSPVLFTTFKDRVNNLDTVEAKALVYTVAFDLDRYHVGFELGTDHPRLEWSDRARPQA